MEYCILLLYDLFSSWNKMKPILFCMDENLAVSTKNISKYILHFDTFANGEYVVKIPKSSIYQNIVYIYKKFFTQTLNQDIISLLFTIRTVAYQKPAKIILLLPYMPYSRKDREDDDSIYFDGLTFKFLLEQFQTLGVDEIITLDIHNPITKYFSDVKITNLKFFDYVFGVFNTWNVFISPDYGSVKNNAILSLKYACENIIVNKIRTGKNTTTFGGLLSNQFAQIDNKEIYIYDDIVDTWWILCHLLDYIIKHIKYTTIKVLFSHPILSYDAVKKLNVYKNKRVVFYTTDSYGNKYTKISNCEVISLSKIYSLYFW